MSGADAPPRYSKRALPDRPYRLERGRLGDTRPTGQHFQPSADALAPRNWQRCEPYLYGVDCFNRGFWWEAHEAWEELWRVAGRESPSGRFLQGLIQLAAALLKRELGNPDALRSLAKKAATNLGAAGRIDLGLDTASLRATALALAAGEHPGPVQLALSLDPVDRDRTGKS